MRQQFAAVVLAGGKSARMGGVAKTELVVGGRSLIERVLEAAQAASPKVVVGNVPPGDYVTTIEDRPGSGPAYALRAGMAHVPATVDRVAVLAADLPFLTAEVLTALFDAINGDRDGAVLVDHSGSRQWLCGVWRTTNVRQCCANARPGDGMGRTLGGLNIAELSFTDSDLPPWFDCDTAAALDYAKRLEREFRTTVDRSGS